MMIGEIDQTNLYLLLPSKVSRLASMIQKHENLRIVDAIREVYLSDTYRKLEDESTKMWHLGPVALYQDMADET